VESQSWYFVGVSPSVSLRLNKLASDRVWFAVVLTSAVVTTGALLAGTVMVKGDQDALSPALQAMPSKART
jgi:hypothetical protein